jgi:acyl-CoA synthetase (NDP forming)
VLQIARAAGMRVVGPNCLGVIDTRARLDASFAPTYPPEGNVAIASQSGAIAIALIDQAAARGVGLASVVSLGNRMDVSSNDLLEYWADDPGVAVIALYLESFGNPRRFPEIARRASRRKPVVVLKSGRSAVGMRAASSHSAALATSDVGVDGVLASAGVMRVATMEELFDLIELLSAQPAPRGSRVGIVTNAGGPGILLADACAARGLATPQLADATRAELRASLPAAAAVDNPVDLTASAPPERFARAVELVGRDASVDAVVAAYIPPYVTRPDEIAEGIATGAAGVARDKPVAAVFMVPGATPPALCRGARGCIPAYVFPENVAAALAKAAAYGRWRDRPEEAGFELPAAARAAVRTIVERQRDGWMSAGEVIELLAAVGVPSTATVCCSADAEDVVRAAERLGYPVVVKAIARGLVHKTEIGGVIAHVHSPAEVRAAVDELATKCRVAGKALDGVIVQHQIRSGIEMLAGMTRDPSLGPMVIVGLGGIAVELLRDVAVRVPPISTSDAADMIGELRAARVLDGFRGAPIGDRAALGSALQRIAAVAQIAPEIAELEVNPLFVMPRGQGVLAIDARARIGRG